MMVQEDAIATVGLTKHFDRHIAVNQLELQIPSGAVYGLIGPNGAGKTTLIRMLATLEEPTIGEIYVFGEKMYPDGEKSKMKQRMGYLPDDFPVYEDLTVMDYLDYFARLYGLKSPYRDRRIYEVLELVQLHYKRNSRISNLSRGMKQRLSLARTILHEPILLLLDEPVSGLDPLARQQFREIVQTLREAGMTILISSHILSDLAEMCTHVGIMELGCLVESAPLTELYQRFGRSRLLITALQHQDTLEQQLQQSSWVQLWSKKNNNTYEVQFRGTEAESAEFLQHLVKSSIPVSEFRYFQDDLDQIFLNLGHQQVS